MLSGLETLVCASFKRMLYFLAVELRNGEILQTATLRAVFRIIKCSEKCARRDWSERAHYISIKHAPYVTRVHS